MFLAPVLMHTSSCPSVCLPLTCCVCVQGAGRNAHHWGQLDRILQLAPSSGGATHAQAYGMPGRGGALPNLAAQHFKYGNASHGALNGNLSHNISHSGLPLNNLISPLGGNIGASNNMGASNPSYHLLTNHLLLNPHTSNAQQNAQNNGKGMQVLGMLSAQPNASNLSDSSAPTTSMVRVFPVRTPQMLPPMLPQMLLLIVCGRSRHVAAKDAPCLAPCLASSLAVVCGARMQDKLLSREPFGECLLYTQWAATHKTLKTTNPLDPRLPLPLPRHFLATVALLVRPSACQMVVGN